MIVMHLFHREEVVESKVKFVDLAGSERQDKQATGDRLKEANAINQDLTSLRRMGTPIDSKASGKVGKCII